MPVVKGTLYINQGKFGWSETYYMFGDIVGSPNDPANLSAVTAKAQIMMNNLCAYRVACLNPINEIVGFRLTEYQSDNKTPLATSLVQSGFPFAGTFGTANAGPWMAVNAEFKSQTSQYTTTKLFRGLDMTSFTFNQGGDGTDIAPSYRGPFTGLTRYLVNQGPASKYVVGYSWGTVVTDKNLANRKIGSITGITYDSETGQAIVTVGQYQSYPLPTFAVGDQVRLGKLKGNGTHGLNGETVILEVGTGNTYKTAKMPKCPGLTANLSRPGVIYNHPKIFVSFSSSQTGRVLKRDTGRAFFVTRGRASGARC